MFAILYFVGFVGYVTFLSILSNKFGREALRYGFGASFSSVLFCIGIYIKDMKK